MPIKFRMLFEATTLQAGAIPAIGYGGSAHTPGWSEGVWANNDTLEQRYIDEIRDKLVPRRLALLCNQAKIIAVKAYISGGGRGISLPVTGTGFGGNADQLQVALLCQSNNPSALYQSKFWLHALPDGQVTNGEFRPDQTYTQAVEDYFANLSGWSFPTTQRTFLSTIHDITTQGLVTLTGNSPFSNGQTVRIIRAVTSTGRQRGATVRITSAGPGPDQFSVSDWDFGKAKGGQVYLPVKNYVFYGPSGNTPTVLRSGVKKIGRPFSGYSGRRSKRR